MKLGAEPKRLVILTVLVLLAGYFLYTGFSSNGAPSAVPSAPAAKPGVMIKQTAPEVSGPVPRSDAPKASASESSLQEFRPSLKPRKGVASGDLSSMDATLRLDLLARLQEVKSESGARSLFEFSAAPLPKTPEPKIIPQPVAPQPPAPVQASKPTAPPIPLKFFGFTTPFQQSVRRAFFLDGDDILVASEGDVLKKRYRVVRIGVNSVVMEDLDYKSEQSLPLEPQVG
jgi:hypothetical protein